jgi:antitoxin (DNA-binding transcriptional repressor) of toxin-antitoxin stability system
MDSHENVAQVSVDDMAHDLPSCLKRVEAGETLVVVKAGKPVAEIKPIAPTVSRLRPFGLCAGEFAVPDDFDAPLPEHIIRAFEAR